MSAVGAWLRRVRRHCVKPVARQLPPDVLAFTGRADALARLDDLVGTAPVGLITGTAGVGKTALAVRWAHRAQDRFRDGQLYANLRGYDADPPATPAEVLGRFLDALGVAGRDIPAGVESRVTMFRALVARRRMLLVLDNAASAAQVRPLLPGTPSCFVLVTGRDSLPDLAARRLELGLLTPGEALALLRNLVGVRAEEDPDAAADLVRHCARLPLALRIVGELANRSSTSLAELVLDLDDRRRRLRVLRAGPTVFSWTYHGLPEEAACLFRRLGWYPGPDLDLPSVAALGQVREREAAELVDVLSQARLLQIDNGRITMHDLLRDYATQLATTHDSEAALSALLDHHLVTATRAVDVFAPFDPISPRTDPAAFADPAAAVAWLDAQRANLIAVALYAADHGRPDHTAQLSRILFRYLDLGAHFDDEALLHTAALRTVDPRDAMPVLGNYSAVLWRSARYHEMLTHLRRALDEARLIGSRRHERRMLGNLCTVHERLGDYTSAVALGQRAITLHDNEADYGEGTIRESLGAAYRKLGRHEHALNHYQQALTTYRRIGAHNEAAAISNIGLIQAELGYPQEAQYHQQQAMATSQQFIQPQHEPEIRNNQGITLRLAGKPHQAIPHHQEALNLATHLGDRYEQARAHQAMAQAHKALADPTTATHHQTQAQALHKAMGTPPN